MPNKIEKGVVASYVSPGVKVDGGGFIIVNGKIIKVPPWGPDFEIFAAGAQILDVADRISDKAIKSQIEKLGKELFTKAAEKIGKSF